MGVDTWPWSVKEGIPQGVPITLRDLIGRPVRIIKHGSARTMEFIAGRVTFLLDADGLVAEVQVEQGGANEK
ncbi:hypothetical protein [Janthinobacterium svalbardensis]|uniref:hypothetical protein n=1 Tax=Janthinobacterium svalbardensis TaxID=368607 RepID=UPI002FCD8301